MAKGVHRVHVAEPKAAYARRPPLVTDASVIAAFLFGEDATAEAKALLLGRTLHAPHLLDCEIASVGLRKQRRGVSAETVTAVLRTYGQLPIERHTVDADNVAHIAQRFNLTAYDAAYLYVAEQLAAPLATLDEDLAAAARAHLAANSQVHERD